MDTTTNTAAETACTSETDALCSRPCETQQDTTCCCSTAC